MASYQETFEKKLDWAMPFQRTGKFPLDRSSIFESYADALAYAKQDGSDNRRLGGTSYVGQIIAVYGLSNDNIEEVAAYIITAVGESAALMKLAQTTATGDFATDIQNLQTSLSTLEGRVKTVEDLVKTLKDTNTTYEITTGVATDGSIHVVTNNPDGTKIEADVQVKGWSTLLGIATGRTTAFVYQNKSDSTYITDIATKDKYKVGDLIYFKDTSIPDQWVTEVLGTLTNSSYYIFSDLEVEHPDLSGYLTTTQAGLTYATKEQVNTKADTSTVNQVIAKVDKNTEDILTKASQDDLNELQTKVDNIDVTNQITAELTKLNADKVGGTGQYIQAIEQHNGVITATAQAMPDVATIAQDAANNAKDAAIDSANAYTDEKIGEVGNVSVKEYVDTQVNSQAQELAALGNRVTIEEEKVQSNTAKISSVETTVNTHTTRITSVETRITTAESKISAIESKIAAVEENAEQNVIEIIRVGGTALAVEPSDRSVNIASISTDLLTQGTKTLIFDCGSASLS